MTQMVEECQTGKISKVAKNFVILAITLSSSVYLRPISQEALLEEILHSI